MRKDIPQAEIDAFLQEPLLATLALNRKDGSVLLSPVWHEWSDGGFSVVLGADDLKVRLLRRDPRVSVIVAQNLPPYKGLEIRTTVRFVGDEGRDVMLRMAVRYLGERMGRAYAESIADDPQTLVRLEPGWMRLWDYADEFGDEG